MRALLALLLLAVPAAVAEPLRLGTEGAFPPYTTLDPQGRPEGLDIDIGNEICRRLGEDCVWVLNDWATIIDNLEAGRYDAILAGMAATDTRRRRMAFTQPYESAPEPSVFVGARGGTGIDIDIDTARIAVQAGTIHAEHLQQTGRQARPYPTAGAALQAVLDGDADLVFGSPAFLEPRVFASGGALVARAREQVPAGGAAIAFRKDDGPLRDRFDTALDAMRDDGSLGALLLKWIPAKSDL